MCSVSLDFCVHTVKSGTFVARFRSVCQVQVMGFDSGS